MALFLFLGKSPPLVLVLFTLVSPLLSDDLGYLRVGKPRVLSDDLALMVLSIQDEGFLIRRWLSASGSFFLRASVFRSESRGQRAEESEFHHETTERRRAEKPATQVREKGWAYRYVVSEPLEQEYRDI